MSLDYVQLVPDETGIHGCNWYSQLSKIVRNRCNDFSVGITYTTMRTV